MMRRVNAKVPTKKAYGLYLVEFLWRTRFLKQETGKPGWRNRAFLELLRALRIVHKPQVHENGCWNVTEDESWAEYVEAWQKMAKEAQEVRPKMKRGKKKKRSIENSGQPPNELLALEDCATEARDGENVDDNVPEETEADFLENVAQILASLEEEEEEMPEFGQEEGADVEEGTSDLYQSEEEFEHCGQPGCVQPAIQECADCGVPLCIRHRQRRDDVFKCTSCMFPESPPQAEVIAKMSNEGVLLQSPKRRRSGRDGRLFSVPVYGTTPERRQPRSQPAGPVPKRVTRSMSAAAGSIPRNID